jgi:drug/metabolite transporter (DMT)-like permease
LIIAAIVLHETLTIPMLAGGVLVLGSTLLITVYEERKRAKTESVPAGP